MSVPTSASAFARLTRRHGVKVLPTVLCSVEDAIRAVGSEVGCDNILAASRMYESIVIYLSSVERAYEAVVQGAVIQGMLTAIVPLETPAQRIIISNAPPFISDETLITELSRFGKLASPVKLIPLGGKLSALNHRREVLNDDQTDLDVTFKFKIGGVNYMVFATSSLWDEILPPEQEEGADTELPGGTRQDGGVCEQEEDGPDPEQVVWEECVWEYGPWSQG